MADMAHPATMHPETTDAIGATEVTEVTAVIEATEATAVIAEIEETVDDHVHPDARTATASKTRMLLVAATETASERTGTVGVVAAAPLAELVVVAGIENGGEVTETVIGIEVADETIAVMMVAALPDATVTCSTTDEAAAIDATGAETETKIFSRRIDEAAAQLHHRRSGSLRRI